MSSAARTRTDPRIRRRRAAVERARKKRFLIAVACVAGGATLIYAAFWSPLLYVRDIAVVGAKHTDISDVRQATGLSSNDNLLLISTTSIERGVETLPWVKSARIERRLPGTVRIRIEERKPALVLSIGSARWTIDTKGRVLEAGVSDKGLPALSGMEIQEVAPGTTLQDAQARAALRVWRSFDAKLRDDVDGMFAPTLERITLSLKDGTLVRYGAAEMLAAKRHVLKALLARLHSEGRHVAYLDVRVPTSPAVGDPQAPPVPVTVVVPTPTPTPTPSVDPYASPSPH